MCATVESAFLCVESTLLTTFPDFLRLIFVMKVPDAVEFGEVFPGMPDEHVEWWDEMGVG